MSIIATKSQGTKFVPLEEGSYAARIYQIIHLGTIVGYQGQMQDKVRISFEVPSEMKVFKEEKGEQPVSLSKEYTVSTHEKSGLRKLIVACDPKGLPEELEGEYDIENLLGKSCLVSVVHNQGKDGAVYANIDVETVLPKGMKCLDAVNEPKLLSYDNFDSELFNTLPQFIQDKMKQSWEYKTIIEGIERPSDEIPF